MAVEAKALRQAIGLGPVAKEALQAGALTIALTVGLVGIETVESGGNLSFVTRFGSVAWAVLIVALGRGALALVRHGRPAPAFAGALVVAVGLALVLLAIPEDSALAGLIPFRHPVVNWTVVLCTAVVALRAGLAMRSQEAAAVADREQVMDRVGARVQYYSRFIAPVLVLLAVALPFLLERRYVDI
ncbi:MAG: hypothetical protein L0210_10930, partial [Rhodospirillales bacterium]|nr:hypothetical protein [Rhodospirillales bacterium]